MFQYSLQQRFQGALLGAIITPTADADRLAVDRLAVDRLSKFTTLINYLCQNTSRPITLESWDALSLTPLWLYTHESWRQRRRWLKQIFGDSDTTTDPPDIAEQWLLSEAIAQVLRPDFRAATAVQRLRDQLTKHGHGAIADQLQLLAQWQAHGAPLTQVMAETSPDRVPISNISSLLLALYCFLETPNMSAIAIARAQQFNDQGRAAQLTGVLLGTHQGWTGFPLAWLGQLDQIQPLSAQLLRSWSGAISSATPVSAPP